MNRSLPLDELGTACCFLQGGKSSICIVRCRSRSLERRAGFLREESLLLCFLLPLDQFGTSCHFPQGEKTLFIIAQLDVLFDSRHSTNLERRAVFSRKTFFHLYCCRRSTNLERRAVY